MFGELSAVEPEDIHDRQAAADDAASVTLDLRAAVHGAVSIRLNQPDQPWPPLTDQIERFLVRLVGVAPAG